jgi:hypothetical protein
LGSGDVDYRLLLNNTYLLPGCSIFLRISDARRSEEIEFQRVTSALLFKSIMQSDFALQESANLSFFAGFNLREKKQISKYTTPNSGKPVSNIISEKDKSAYVKQQADMIGKLFPTTV